MNERILELAKESGLITDQTSFSEVEKLHEFAQSVVKECTVIISQRRNNLTGDHWISHNNAVHCCYMDVQDHFEST